MPNSPLNATPEGVEQYLTPDISDKIAINIEPILKKRKLVYFF